MRAGGVVVREVTAQQASEMPFVDHDDVIEAFPSNRPDDALGEGILPGRSRGDEDLAHPQAFHASYEHIAVGSVPIAEQRSEEHTSELQSLAYLVCRLLLEKKKLFEQTAASTP